MKIKVLSLLLVILGLIASFGHIVKNDTIKGIGLLTVASPLPIVFTQHKGMETFAWDFSIVYKEGNFIKELQITPEIYSKFNQPYNYRNVVGAAFAYAPILPKNLVKSVLDYSFVDPAPLSKTFGLTQFKLSHIKLMSKTKNKKMIYTTKIGGTK
ncbi:MAG: Unknown protein [uncultured Campylobacterales bacterium]|uniref:Uncharacterized protein n=1 Tax=uncultured Campylobacterales bacterium TaxID=352960 RepID=A0A6S6T0J7_9BACT|nr:MAG: Unknown protein [uncultured Campylobacterales bacterium]